VDDESLFFFHLDGCLILNCLFLVHFHQLGFIGPLFKILINLTLIGLIFILNYFWEFCEANFGAWMLIIR